MPSIKPLDQLRKLETPDKSFRWYLNTIRKVGLASYSANRAMKTDIGEFTADVEIGNMYLFLYDPKNKETLPYYDAAPLVVAFRTTLDGFYGLNLHYLPPMMRMRLFGNMIDASVDKLDEGSKIMLKWSVLKNISRFPGSNVCVKKYLYSQVSSRLLKINPKIGE